MIELSFLGGGVIDPVIAEPRPGIPCARRAADTPRTSPSVIRSGWCSGAPQPEGRAGRRAPRTNRPGKPRANNPEGHAHTLAPLPGEPLTPPHYPTGRRPRMVIPAIFTRFLNHLIPPCCGFLLPPVVHAQVSFFGTAYTGVFSPSASTTPFPTCRIFFV